MSITHWWRGSEIHKAASAGELSKVIKHIENNGDPDAKDPQLHTPLSLAAKNGHFHVVRELLANGRVNPDSRNHLGQTPLFLASAFGHRVVVKHLADNSRVDLNSRDSFAETPLSQAAKNGHSGVVKELLSTGKVEPDYKNNKGQTALSQASVAGHHDVVRQLLANGRVDLNATDELSDTALSLAAREGHASVVKDLLASGKVHPNTKNLSGQTPLSLAATAGHLEVVEQLLKDISVDVNTRDADSMTPLLHAVQGGHVEVSKKLLAAGAVASLTSSYGQAAQDLVREKLLTTNAEEYMKYKRIKSLLEAPPAITRRSSGHIEERPTVAETVWPPDSSYRRSGICKSFQARVEFHKQGGFQPWSTSVWDLLYGGVLPDELVTWRRNFADWKWVHLPANNKAWVKDLIQTLCMEGTLVSTIDAAHKFFEESFLEAKGSSLHSSYRRPGVVHGSLSPGQNDFAVVIPYFDMENKDYLDYRYGGVQFVVTKHFQMMQDLEGGYKTRAHASTEDLHVSRTLDQSYYTSLMTTKDRDYDQVIYRYTEKNTQIQRSVIENLRSHRGDTFSMSDSHDCASLLTAEAINPDDIKGKATPQLLMVNSIWIWKLGNTIITAFPERWNIGPNSLLDQILLHPTTTSLEDAFFRIVRETVGFVDEPCNAGLDENWYSIFEQSIADQANNETECYKKFEDLMEQSHEAEGQIEDNAWDVSNEMAHLRVVKDIRDELHMVKRVISEQEDVVQSLYGKAEKRKSTGNTSKITLQDEDQLLDSVHLRLRKVDKLEREALMVEQRFKDLLDLKQKQGNLTEARDMKRLADKAEQRALESEFQSNLLFVFTIVTVIFVPISFISSLYAIPSADFPHQDGNISWSISRIGTAMGVSEAVILLPMLIYWMFNRIKSAVKKQAFKLQRKIVFTPPKLQIVDTSQEPGKDGEPKVPTRQNTANTLPIRQTTANTLPPSNPKFLQVILPRTGAAHVDASNGV